MNIQEQDWASLQFLQEHQSQKILKISVFISNGSWMKFRDVWIKSFLAYRRRSFSIRSHYPGYFFVNFCVFMPLHLSIPDLDGGTTTMHSFRPPLILPLLGQASPDADISKEEAHLVKAQQCWESESFVCAERRSLLTSYWKRPPWLHLDFSSTYLANNRKPQRAVFTPPDGK